MALRIGVSYELFWHLNPTKLKPFIKAYEQRKQELSYEMWLMGQYNGAALDATVCNAMPFVKRRKKGSYPDEPFRVIPLTEEEGEQDERMALEQCISLFGVLEKNIKKSESE